MEIAIMNRSSGMSDKYAAKIAAAINRQVQRDFLDHWGGPEGVWVEFDMRPEAADWVITIEDTSDYAGAAGCVPIWGAYPDSRR